MEYTEEQYREDALRRKQVWEEQNVYEGPLGDKLTPDMKKHMLQLIEGFKNHTLDNVDYLKLTDYILKYMGMYKEGEKRLDYKISHFIDEKNGTQTFGQHDAVNERLILSDCLIDGFKSGNIPFDTYLNLVLHEGTHHEQHYNANTSKKIVENGQNVNQELADLVDKQKSLGYINDVEIRKSIKTIAKIQGVSEEEIIKQMRYETLFATYKNQKEKESKDSVIADKKMRAAMEKFDRLGPDISKYTKEESDLIIEFHNLPNYDGIMQASNSEFVNAVIHSAYAQEVYEDDARSGAIVKASSFYKMLLNDPGLTKDIKDWIQKEQIPHLMGEMKEEVKRKTEIYAFYQGFVKIANEVIEKNITKANVYEIREDKLDVKFGDVSSLKIVHDRIIQQNSIEENVQLLKESVSTGQNPYFADIVEKLKQRTNSDNKEKLLNNLAEALPEMDVAEPNLSYLLMSGKELFSDDSAKKLLKGFSRKGRVKEFQFGAQVMFSSEEGLPIVTEELEGYEKKLAELKDKDSFSSTEWKFLSDMSELNFNIWNKKHVKKSKEFKSLLKRVDSIKVKATSFIGKNKGFASTDIYNRHKEINSKNAKNNAEYKYLMGMAEIYENNILFAEAENSIYGDAYSNHMYNTRKDAIERMKRDRIYMKMANRGINLDLNDSKQNI